MIDCRVYELPKAEVEAYNKRVAEKAGRKKRKRKSNTKSYGSRGCAAIYDTDLGAWPL